MSYETRQPIEGKPVLESEVRVDSGSSVGTGSLDGFWANQQRCLAETLEGIVPQGSTVVFFDVPVYMNVGDLMIYLGTEWWMKSQRLRILGRWSVYDFRFPDLPADAVILLQGGGNFGDLYPFQRFREQLIEGYPANRIVGLPQTILYGSDTVRTRSAQILQRHPDLHLLLRDHRSLEEARALAASSNCQLASDMSIFLYPLPANLGFHPALRPSGTLYLLRQDTEAVPRQTIPDCGAGWRGDWRALLGPHLWHLRAEKLRHLVGAKWMPSVSTIPAWHRAAKRAVRHCARRFTAVETVITSRLHGHLLASLLGVSNVVLDNCYGKNSSYFECWHRDLRLARLGETSDF